MKKISLFLLAIFYSVVSFSLEIKGNKIYDSNDNSIELKKYKRIIVADPAVIETMYMLGTEEKIVGIASASRSKIWPYDKTPSLPSVGNVSKPSFEKILSFEPDLVILTGMATGITNQLKNVGIPVIINDSSGNFDNILNGIKIFGFIFDKEAEADRLYDQALNNLNEIKSKKISRGKELKGAVLYSTSPMMAFTKDSLPGEVLELLGIKNIADGVVGERPIISPEYLLKQNPDILMGAMSMKTAKEITDANPFVKETKAGKNNSIFIVDSSQILRGSPRIFGAIKELKEEIEKCLNSK